MLTSNGVQKGGAKVVKGGEELCYRGWREQGRSEEGVTYLMLDVRACTRPDVQLAEVFFQKWLGARREMLVTGQEWAREEGKNRVLLLVVQR